MITLRLIGPLAGCILAMASTTAEAAQVRYVLEGDWFLFSGTDDYSLDGAHFLWTVTADAASPPVSTGADAFGSQIAFYGPLSSQIAFTNRSNSAPDTIATGALPLLITTNASVGSGRTDIFQTDSYYLDGDFSDLVITQFSLNFTEDFYLAGGFAPLPESFDLTKAINPFSGGGSIFNPFDDNTTKYSVSSWSMSVRPVPIPAAVYLFGSGLLGLLIVARKAGGL